MNVTIRIFTTGGTFDKVYFDAKSEFTIGDPTVSDLLQEANHNLADPSELFKQVYIDEAKLSQHVRQCLESQTTVSLTEVLDRFPLQQGVAELVAYVKLASETNHTLIDDERKDTIRLELESGIKMIQLPRILFTR